MIPQDGAAADYPLWHPMTPMAAYLKAPVTIAGGSGARLYDDEGTEYLSANAGLWNIHCGFDEPRIQEAVREQLEVLTYSTLFRFAHEPALRLARRLVDIAPAPGLTRVFYGTSGASGVDAALKLARRYQRLTGRGERTAVGALADSYHGTLYGALSVTGEDLDQDEYGVDRSAVVHVPTPLDAATAAAALERLDEAADGLAAVIVEPILGSAGVLVPHPDFFRGLSELCRSRDILLIADEVATGFGRTGTMFCSEQFGLEPDAVVLSKGINSGYLPLSAVLVHERVWAAFQEREAALLTGETQAGNPLACAAALATLDVIEEDKLVPRAARLGAELSAALSEVLPRARGQAREPVGRGLMLGVHLEGSGTGPGMDEVSMVVERFRSLGVIVHPSERGFALLPPLVVTEDDVRTIAEAAGRVFDELDLR
ncbi:MULTISPECIES: aspartate aminotransferase family protein [Streptomonospora]|uniref:Aspartate aminotransferase family protein n=2 Tax=Streptomonospora TaxID=104204 RepID=A0ABV9SS25_9ACTN